MDAPLQLTTKASRPIAMYFIPNNALVTQSMAFYYIMYILACLARDDKKVSCGASFFRGIYSFNHDGILYPPLTEINEMLQGFLLILLIFHFEWNFNFVSKEFMLSQNLNKFMLFQEPFVYYH